MYINYDTFNPNEIRSKTLNQRQKKGSQVWGTICGILSATNLCQHLTTTVLWLEAEHDHEEKFSRARVERATIMRDTWDTVIRCWLKYVIEDPMDGVVGQDFRRSNSSLAYLAAVMTIGVEKKDYNFKRIHIYIYIFVRMCVFGGIVSNFKFSIKNILFRIKF